MTDIDRLKKERKIELRAQYRREAQVRRSQFNHDQALARIDFSEQEGKLRLNYNYAVIRPELEKIDRQVLTAGSSDG
jgi:hypothetical protein